MAVNAYGAVQLLDFGNPKVITGVARETISGGQLVFTSGATGVVSSGADSFATSDIKFATGASGTAFTGVALNTATSGNLVAVAVEGVFLLDCITAVANGEMISAGGGDSVAATAAAGQNIGRVLGAGASGGFCIAYIK